MNIINIAKEEYLSGIPLKGLDAVKAALKIFYEGRTKGSDATQRRLVKDGGFDTLVLKTLGEQGSRDVFLENLFSRIDTDIKDGNGFHHHFDYDGIGPFFKTTVDVKIIDPSKDTYLLSLSAAYVGNEVEKGLAETLDIERGLEWIKVKVEVPPVGDKFLIDFETVVGRLNIVFNASKFSGKKIVQSMLVKDRYGDSQGVTLLKTKEFSLVMKLEDVARCYNYSSGEEKRTWFAKGSVLEGPLYKLPSKSLTPVVVFVIDDTSETLLPILDSNIKRKARELADKIEAAFK